MTRLVNTYNIWMAKYVISEIDIDSSDKLARWLIITLRWAYLVDYLQKHPELITQVDDVIDSKNALLDDKLNKILYSGPTIMALVKGDDEMAPINRKTIRKLLTM